MGTAMPTGLPWRFWVRLLGTTMGTVVSGHFKLDFKSQVGFKKLIQFSSLRGTDLLPRRLRKGLADLLWVPHRDHAWATATCPHLRQAGAGASLGLPLQGAEDEISSHILAFILP